MSVHSTPFLACLQESLPVSTAKLNSNKRRIRRRGKNSKDNKLVKTESRSLPSLSTLDHQPLKATCDKRMICREYGVGSDCRRNKALTSKVRFHPLLECISLQLHHYFCLEETGILIQLSR